MPALSGHFLKAFWYFWRWPAHCPFNEIIISQLQEKGISW